MVGGPWVLEAVKALQFCLFGSTAAVLVAYYRPAAAELAGGVRERWPRPWLSRRFLVGRSLTWPLLVAAGLCEGVAFPLLAYLTDGVGPASQPGQPDLLRAAALLTVHAGLLGRWADARPGEFGWRFGVGWACTAAASALVFAVLPPG